MPTSRQNGKLLAGVGFILSCLSSLLLANPSGGVIRHGDIVIDSQGSTLNIYQGTDQGIIDWNSFSIASGETTRFIQPSSNSITLNRVTGQSVSRIDGRLTANGRIFLLNPNGVVVGQGGVIDVAGFTASTLDLNDRDFLAGGDFRFTGSSQASIVNLGEISAFEGDVFLVASSVINAGNIRAENGTVGLAAGNDVLIAESGSERVFVKGASGSMKENGVLNEGTVEANVAELKSYGGNVYGMAVKNEGRVAATGVTRRGGQIFLSAGGSTPGSGGRVQSSGTLVARPVAEPVAEAVAESEGKPGIRIDAGNGGEVEISGRVDASGDSIGGTVVILGETVNLLAESVILADGVDQGGRILIGGGRRGLDPEFMNATDVSVSPGARISASAGERGDGGEVIFFAERDLVFRGFASARGGAQSGDGGFVELSGKRSVDVGSLSDSIDVGASQGIGGMLLFDPEDILIRAGSAEDFFTTGTDPPVTSDSLLYSDDISAFLAGSSLRIETDANSTGSGSGNITLQSGADLNWSSASFLDISAMGTFFMEPGSSITSQYAGSLPGGDVKIFGGTGVQLGVAGTGGASIHTETGSVSIASKDASSLVDPAEAIRGIQLYESEIISGTGDIGIKGWSNQDNHAGLGLYDSRVFSVGGLDPNGGDLDLSGANLFLITDPATYQGSGAEGLEAVVGSSTFFSPQDSFPVIGTTGTGTVSLFGQAQGEESAIEFDGLQTGNWLGDSAGTGPVEGLRVVGGGGSTTLFGVEAANMNYSVLGGALSPLSLGGVIGNFSAENADWVEIRQTSGDLSLGDINATWGLDVSLDSGDLLVSGTIVSDQVSFLGWDRFGGQVFDFSTMPTTNSIAVSDVETVNTRGNTVDLGVFTFNRVNEVVGSGPTSRIVGSDLETKITVLTQMSQTASASAAAIFSAAPSSFVQSTSPDTGDTVFEISEYDPFPQGESGGGSWTEITRFSGFQEVSGGGGDDTFDIRLDSGAAYGGTLRGGEGNDQFLFGNEEIPLGGTEFRIAAINGGAGNGTAEMDTIDFSYLGAPVTADFGAGNVRWGSGGEVGSVTGMERVFGDLGATVTSPNVLRGTSGADRFEITQDNGGLLNKGQFFGFGRLEGAGGPDQFLFTNQANVGEVIGGFGFDTLTIDDRNLTGTNVYTISDNTITRNPTYTFSELEVLQLLLGPGNDTVATTDNGLIQFLNGGFGFDAINFGGVNVVGQNPYIIGGTTIYANGFEDPAPIANVGNESEELLTQQTQNVPTPGGLNGSGGGVVDQFTNSGNSPLPSLGGLGMGGNAFSAAVTGQAVVIQLDGNQYLLQAPASLDGTFSLPSLSVIEALKGNLGPEEFRELADSIEFDGGTILVMSDGAFSIDLTQVPPADLLAILQGNLAVDAASELVNALEMTLVIPVTAQDGALGIVAIPIAVPPDIVNLLTQLLAQDSFDELAAALDGP